MKHLIIIMVGPVQDFIKSARRTRDLWFGSEVLSEISRAVAKSLEQSKAELIFPGSVEASNVANRIQAVLPDGVDPETAARAAQTSALNCWMKYCSDVKNKCSAILADNIEAAWKEQVETFIEFYATWAPLTDYAATLGKLETASAARKNLRDFKQYKHQRGAVPKSSLDGTRETVLIKDHSGFSKFRIAKGEQLDAIGLVKRVGGKPGQFIPLANIALAKWMEKAAVDASAEMDNLKVVSAGNGLDKISRKGCNWLHVFPYDAQVFLPGRLDAMEKSGEMSTNEVVAVKPAVEQVLRKMKQPYPYVACIVADGDLMGVALSKIQNAEKHSRFSSVLASFEMKARKIVEQDHSGALIYCGGDDVLAFINVSQAIACADALRKEFNRVISQAMSGSAVTLSVGIGIGHVLESMGDLLELGRAAERLAKKRRNSLGIIVDKRSGGTIEWTDGWDASESPAARLASDINILSNRLSSKKVYEVRRDQRTFPSPRDIEVLDNGRRAAFCAALKADVGRTIKRTDAGGSRLGPQDVGLDTSSTDYGNVYASIESWVSRMLVARTIVEAEPQSKGGQ